MTERFTKAELEEALLLLRESYFHEKKMSVRSWYDRVRALLRRHEML